MGRATAVLLMAACSGGAGQPRLDGGVADDARSQATADGGGSMLTLVEHTWTLPPTAERYYCVRKTVTSEIYIGRFEPIIPLGTHHTVLTLDDGDQPDGVTACGAAVGAPQMIYGSGVGTQPFDMPQGVAIKVSPGQQLLLNLHLYNTGDLPLSGTSGVRVRTMAREQVVHEAEAILAGTVQLVIPPGPSMFTGRCTMPAAGTIFGVGAHMHKLGVHQKVSVEASGQILLDRSYSFDEQVVSQISAAVSAGDRVRVDCSYANDTGGYVTWGESTEREMCFAILFRYPATGQYHVCLN